mgnify:CR=1 FL=1
MFDKCCSACGTGIAQEDRFCRLCGMPVASNTRVQEYRYITALYTDLSRYTTLSSLLDPEDLKSLMDGLFSEASRIITSYEGVVEKFSGDAVVALFGIHHIHEDDIVRAIHSARSIHSYVEGKKRLYPLEKLHMHSGIHTGTVVFDHKHTRNATHGAMGMPINIAARLSSLAAPGEILVGKSARNEAERFFHLEFMGERELKGVIEPVAVFKVGAQRRVPLSIHRPVGVNTEMIGRSGPLWRLKDAYDDLMTGNGGLVLVSGEAGVGKSRLVHEFRGMLDSKASVFVVQCQDHLRDIPYYLFISLIRQMLETKAGSQGEPGAGIEDVLPNPGHAFHIRSLLMHKNDGKGLMPDVWKTEIFEAVTSFIEHFSKVSSLIVCIEDLHWADATSMDLLRIFATGKDLCRRVLFIVTSREDHFEDKLVPGIFLKDLNREESRQLFCSMLGNAQIPDRVQEYLYRVTGGNPFYIEEFCSYFRDKGMSMDGLTDVLSTVPITIHGLISARIEGSGSKDKRVLQDAAVIGAVFPRKVLDAIHQESHDLSAVLKRLEERGFISIRKGQEYSFRHALFREVAYTTLLRRHRAEIHAKIGFHLERAYSGRTDESGLIAYHFYHAGEYERAYPYCMTAAGIFQAEGSWIEASCHYRVAQECLLKASGIEDRQGLLVNVLEGIWNCSRVFDPDEAISALENLQALYQEAGLKTQELYARVRLINLYSQKARFNDAFAAFDAVCAEAGENGYLMAAARTVTAYTYTFLGKPMKALEYLQQARGSLGPADRFLRTVNYLTTLAACVWIGGIKDADLWYTRTKELSCAYLDFDLIADTWHAYILFLKGDLNEGQRIFDAVREKEKTLGPLAGGLSYLRIQSTIYLYSRYCGRLDRVKEELCVLDGRKDLDESSSALLRLYHAWTALEEGRYEDVVQHLSGVDTVFESGIANRLPYALNALGEALFMKGDFIGAASCLERCLAWNQENGNVDQQIWALRTFASVKMEQGSMGEARQSLLKASMLACELQMKPHAAWNLCAWGDFHAVKKSWKKARACYERSISLWEKMDSFYQAAKIRVKLAGIPGGLP